MKIIPLISLLLLLITTLEADYLRTIRIGSFVKEKDARESLIMLKEFASKHDNIVDLQLMHGFEFKARKSGKYYITIVEPLTSRVVLQELLDTLRLEYEGVYVTKLKPKKVYHKQLDVIPDIDYSEKKALISEQITPMEKTTINKIEKVEAIVENDNVSVEPLEMEVLKIDKDENNYTDNVWMTLFFITFFVLLFFIKSRTYYKNRDEDSETKEMIAGERLSQTILEMKKKEKFLSYTSHELRTPMTAIIGLTHLVLESELSKSQQDYMQKIEGSAQHLLSIVNDILDISKLEEAEVKIEKVEFNINDILEYVINIVVMQAKNNNVKVSMDVDKDVPSLILGDSLRLGQVLINLLSNSVKFTQDGDVTLLVKKLDTFGNDVTLEFSIIDTGIGMTMEQVKNIFESYSQASESTSRKFGGTGLGLAISKQLVELMNGKIQVQSKKDVGTTFSFTIDFQLKDSENKRQYRLPSSKLLGKNILVVDSSNTNVILLMRYLGYFNYTVNTIPSFEEAALEKEVKYDIVISHQSKLTKHAISKIKEIKKDNEVKVIVLSELYSTLHNDKLDELKIDAYLRTPFTQQNILNMIIELYVVKNLDKRSRKINSKDKLIEIKNKKVLVVEDNTLNHKVISGLLSGTSITLTFVTNGQEAIDLLFKGMSYDLVLMDINMPIMNGYEATLEIRKHSKYNTLPILALTADIMEESIQKAISSGMQGYITKPIIVDIFYKKIRDAINHTKVEINRVKSIKSKDDYGYEELSVSMGLGRCENDKAFYKSILKEFKVMYINSSINLQELCINGRFKEARTNAMDIKDVSLNIGAYNLCEHAATMEYEFEKGPRSEWKNLLELYTASLESLFKEIDKYVRES